MAVGGVRRQGGVWGGGVRPELELERPGRRARWDLQVVLVDDVLAVQPAIGRTAAPAGLAVDLRDDLTGRVDDVKEDGVRPIGRRARLPDNRDVAGKAREIRRLRQVDARQRREWVKSGADRLAYGWRRENAIRTLYRDRPERYNRCIAANP